MNARQQYEMEVDRAFSAIIRLHRAAERLDDHGLLDDCSAILQWLAECEKISAEVSLGKGAPSAPRASAFVIPF